MRKCQVRTEPGLTISVIGGYYGLPCMAQTNKCEEPVINWLQFYFTYLHFLFLLLAGLA